MNTEKIQLTQLSQIADQVEYLEALFVDLDAAPESQRVASAKLRTLEMLAAAYNKGGFCRAAAECLKLSEPYFCQTIAHKGQSLDDKFIDSLVWSYLALGAYTEARRAARLTADAVSLQLGKTPKESARIARWYNEQFQATISTHEKSAINLALRVRLLKGSKTVASTSENEVVSPLPVMPQAIA